MRFGKDLRTMITVLERVVLYLVFLISSSLIFGFEVVGSGPAGTRGPARALA